MTHYGAQHDLRVRIRKHLFVISPNNSGSTFLKNALATSKATWNLVREGQHALGFHGPSTSRVGARLIWASDQRWIDMFTDEGAYDWEASRQAWYFQAFSRCSDASVMVVKSPPFLLITEALERHFGGACFLFLVRNPYAVVEGICRRPNSAPHGTDMLQVAAAHVLECLRRQRANIARHRHNGLFFTYEAMCAEPREVGAAIQRLVPELQDLDLDQVIPVKGLYESAPRDMNREQIERLSPRDITRLGEIFSRDKATMDHFGYELL